MNCKKCGKPGWAGCGAHVEQVLGDVPKASRCRCNDKPAKAAAPAGERRSFMDRLRGG